MGKLGSASHHPLLPYDLTRANGSKAVIIALQASVETNPTKGNTFVVFFINLVLNFRAPFGPHKTLFRKRLSQKRSRNISIGLLVGPGEGGRGDGIFGSRDREWAVSGMV